MAGSSIIIENPLSGSAPDNVSIKDTPEISGTAKIVSIFLETVTRGGFGAEGDIIFYGYELSKNPILNKVIVEWKTNPATKGRIRWRVKGSGNPWSYTSFDLTFLVTHIHQTGMLCTPGAAYEFQAYGIDEVNYEEWDVLKYIKITEAGEPIFED